MIQANFVVSDGKTVGFSVGGHALFDVYGKDIVCAAVSSAVQMTVNGITEILHQRADVQVVENQISLILQPPYANHAALSMIEAFRLHIQLLSEDYLETIEITISEV